MSKQTLEAKLRTATGKTAAKNLRKVGRIPAVVYNSKGEATSIEVGEVEFNKIWRTITPTTSITLKVYIYRSWRSRIQQDLENNHSNNFYHT